MENQIQPQGGQNISQMSQDFSKLDGSVISLHSYVGGDRFQLYLSVMRQIARYDPGSKSWRFSLDKAQRSDVASICKQLSGFVTLPIDVKGNSTELLFQFLNTLCTQATSDRRTSISIYVSGNYARFKIPSNSDMDDSFRAVLNHLEKELTVEIKQFDPSSGRYTIVPYQFYFIKDGSFITYRGLLPIIQRVFTSKIQYSVSYSQDLEKIINTVKSLDLETALVEVQEFLKSKGKTLRPYQIDAIRSSIRDMVSHGGFLIQLPTGAGKTLTSFALLRVLNKVGIRSMFTVVGMRDLAIQWKEEASKYLGDLYSDIGLMYSDEKNLYRDSFNIATYQSLLRFIDTSSNNQVRVNLNDIERVFQESQLVIVDEVHHLPATSIKSLVLTNRYLHGGLSATPFREDQFDLMLYGLTSVPSIALKLIDPQFHESSILTPVNVVNVNIDFLTFDPDFKVSDSLDFESDKFVKFMRTLLLDKRLIDYTKFIVAKFIEKYNLPVVVHTPLESIGKAFAELSGIPLLSGSSKGIERDRLLDGLRTNQVKASVVTTVLDEGIDIPPLSCMIELIPGSSRVKLIQRLGRLTRVYPNKSKGIALLFNYKSDRPDVNRILANQKVKRDRFLQDYGISVTDVYWKDILTVI